MPIDSQYFFHPGGTTDGVLIKGSSGRLVSVQISNVSNSAAVTLYNAKSAINPMWTSGAMGANTQPLTVQFDGLSFNVGLFMVVSGAGANVTVAYA